MKAPATLVETMISLLVAAGFVFLLGLLFMRRLGYDTPSWQARGRVMLRWMVAGLILGGIGEAYSPRPDAASTGPIGIGLLFGWAIGAAHACFFVDDREGSNQRVKPPPGYRDRFTTPQPGAPAPPDGIQRGDSFSPPPEDQP